MKAPQYLLAATVCMLALVAPAAMAQSLEEGTWTGTVAPPDGPSLEVTYEVSSTDEGLAITMHAEPGSFTFNDVKLEGDELTFSWQPGPFLQCSLFRQEDATFTGDCVDAQGSPGHLVMIPPTDE